MHLRTRSTVFVLKDLQDHYANVSLPFSRQLLLQLTLPFSDIRSNFVPYVVNIKVFLSKTGLCVLVYVQLFRCNKLSVFCWFVFWFLQLWLHVIQIPVKMAQRVLLNVGHSNAYVQKAELVLTARKLVIYNPTSFFVFVSVLACRFCVIIMNTRSYLT